jgi:hypothetical protein
MCCRFLARLASRISTASNPTLPADISALWINDAQRDKEAAQKKLDALRGTTRQRRERGVGVNEVEAYDGYGHGESSPRPDPRDH